MRNKYIDAANRLKLNPGARKHLDALVASGGEAMLQALAVGSNVRTTIHNDADQLAFLAQQLEHIYAGLYEQEYPELAMANGDVIPLDRSVPPGAETFGYYVYAGGGVAQWASSYSTGSDMPRTVIAGAKVEGRVQSMELGYGYTQRDVRNAAFAGLPLDRMLATPCREGHARKLNTAGSFGSEEHGIPGYYTHPNITVIDVITQSGPTTLWASKTIDQRLADIALGINTLDDVSNGMRLCNFVGLSPALHRMLVQTRMGAGDGTLTMMQFLEATYRGVTWKRINELAASKSGGHLDTDAIIFACIDPRWVGLVVPMDFVQYPPQLRGLTVEIPCESSTGGVRLVEPLTVVRMDGAASS